MLLRCRKIIKNNCYLIIAWAGLQVNKPILTGAYPHVKMRYQFSAPPSSSGLGRSPLKAQTGVRVPLGALKIHLDQGGFFYGL